MDRGCALDLPFHGGNRGSNPLGDAISVFILKFNGLQTASASSLYRRNVYFLYRNGVLLIVGCALAATKCPPPNQRIIRAPSRRRSGSLHRSHSRTGRSQGTRPPSRNPRPFPPVAVCDS